MDCVKEAKSGFVGWPSDLEKSVDYAQGSHSGRGDRWHAKNRNKRRIKAKRRRERTDKTRGQNNWKGLRERVSINKWSDFTT